ncbi:LysR family transcriptional regulator [Pendulispora albinea]|uniref:LysR family transcriptional regulator n=1 Tax=Pendulispora albinea TaxID=2741071 RepID=A0ABZ2LNV9_9BACT
MDLDWDDLRLVLAIAREGALTGAARRLGVSQPTAGRRLAAFEARLGFSPFERTTQGFRLTPLGRELVESLERMDEGALAFGRKAAGRESQASEALTVSCVEWVATWILAPGAGAFIESHPTIRLEITAELRKVSLSRHEADVAIRHVRFEQLDLVQKKMADLPSALYASDAYLRAYGKPRLDDGCAGHHVLNVTDSFAHIADQRWLRDRAFAARITFRSNNFDAILRAAQSGAGLAVLPCILGDGAKLVRLGHESAIPTRELWAGYHKDLRRTQRIAAFLRYVKERLSVLLTARTPPRS